MATVTLTADKASAQPGDTIVFTATYAGLDSGTPASSVSGPGHIDARLSSGVVISDDSPSITVTTPARPAETVTQETVSFMGATATRRSDGKFQLTVP